MKRCDVCGKKKECVSRRSAPGTGETDQCCTCSAGDYRAPYDPRCDECVRLDEIRERSYRGVVKRFQASVEEADEILMQNLRDSITMAQWRKGNTDGTL